MILFAVGLVSCQSTKQKETKQPNVILIVADDLGWMDLGYSCSNFYETPNIDALAASGMTFTDAYAASPVCSPTRSSIMCGKAPARTKNTDWFGAPQPDTKFPGWMGHKNRTLEPAYYVEHMPLEEITIAEALRDKGYKTFIAGKWHLGHEEEYWPENQGFEINKGGFSMGYPPLNDEADGYFSPYGNPRLNDGPKGEYLPYRLLDETRKFIQENKDEPFFIYYSFYLVHTPIQAREELIAKYQQKRDSLKLTDEFVDFGEKKLRTVQSNVAYAAMIETMDQVVGKIAEEVKESNIDENTIIIFTADNGGLSTNWAPTSNLPLKGGKGWVYEGGIREPMFVVWPGITKPESKCSEPVLTTDFYRTIVEMTGIEQPPQQALDGASLVPLLKQVEGFDRKAICWHYPHYSPQGGKPASAIRSGDWKLIKSYETNQVELYNLKADIGETKNLSEEHIELKQRLETELNDWLKEVDASMPSRK
ncbi:sulfatase [Labilibacter sediminis]|nr:sulfatase [Labilibacter sediminis]